MKEKQAADPPNRIWWIVHRKRMKPPPFAQLTCQMAIQRAMDGSLSSLDIVKQALIISASSRIASWEAGLRMLPGEL